MFVLKDTTPGNPLLLHDEPIYLGGKIVGETTSGNYSFIYNKNLAYGYINDSVSLEEENQIFEIEVAKKKYKAFILKHSLHDPKNLYTKK